MNSWGAVPFSARLPRPLHRESRGEAAGLLEAVDNLRMRSTVVVSGDFAHHVLPGKNTPHTC